VKPPNLFNVAFGSDDLFHKGKGPRSTQLTSLNLADDARGDPAVPIRVSMGCTF
jgi:hypothetical protein